MNPDDRERRDSHIDDSRAEGDPKLESQLDTAGVSVLATRDAVPPAIAAAAAEAPGAVIGRYLVLERIGSGGFGTVFAAEQREPDGQADDQCRHREDECPEPEALPQRRPDGAVDGERAARRGLEPLRGKRRDPLRRNEEQGRSGQDQPAHSGSGSELAEKPQAYN